MNISGYLAYFNILFLSLFRSGLQKIKVGEMAFVLKHEGKFSVLGKAFY